MALETSFIVDSDVARWLTLSLVSACRTFIFMICQRPPSGCDDRHDKCI